MYSKKDRLINYPNAQMFGEIDYFDSCNGTVCRMLFDENEFLFCENLTDSRSGFIMEYETDSFSIGKYRYGMMDGPFISRNGDDIAFQVYKDDRENSPFVMFDTDSFYVSLEIENDTYKCLYFGNNTLSFIYNDRYNRIEKKIIDNFDFRFDFRKNLFWLKPYNKASHLSIDSRSDYKKIKQEFNTSNPYGYGYIEWEDNESCISEFYGNDRHGFGCYRWPTGIEYYGQFSMNKVDGLGVFSKKGKYELGVYKNKKKNGNFIEIDSNYVWFRKYSDDYLLKGEYMLDLKTFNLTCISPDGSKKVYYFYDIIGKK
jgi:hypothetical protein